MNHDYPLRYSMQTRVQLGNFESVLYVYTRSSSQCRRSEWVWHYIQCFKKHHARIQNFFSVRGKFSAILLRKFEFFRPPPLTSAHEHDALQFITHVRLTCRQSIKSNASFSATVSIWIVQIMIMLGHTVPDRGKMMYLTKISFF